MRREVVQLLALADALIRATARRLRGNRATIERVTRAEADYVADDTGDHVRPMSHATPVRDALDEGSCGRADYVPSWAEPMARKTRRKD